MVRSAFLLAAAVAALLLPTTAAQPWTPASPMPSDRIAAPRIAGDGTDLTVTWTGGARWLDGFDAGLEALNGSLARGRRWIFGNSTVTTDAAFPLEIRFDSTQTTLAQIFSLGSGFDAVGVGIFRGSAWDLSDPAAPRRLNVVFTERGNTTGTNGVWDPDASTQGGIECCARWRAATTARARPTPGATSSRRRWTSRWGGSRACGRATTFSRRRRRRCAPGSRA